ncbi:unnamed protein product [Dibothriocephalus latus]|uniref:Uncharacterized protein n=1 Tax=Dibothriocephalus latus TaxID=60516 RepID=A0A3P7QKQ6_DIBLA|nr:unnamed protein product [Dibothriocephalus latus]
MARAQVHKEGVPLRPIVSLKYNQTYGLAKWLFRRLKFVTSEAEATVRASAQSLEKLKGDLAVDTVDLLLRSEYNETKNRLGRAQILQLLQFCLKTYFTFDGTIYEQVKWTPMGSPISGFIADEVRPAHGEGTRHVLGSLLWPSQSAQGGCSSPAHRITEKHSNVPTGQMAISAPQIRDL